jgi:hypothetical protein
MSSSVESCLPVCTAVFQSTFETRWIHLSRILSPPFFSCGWKIIGCIWRENFSRELKCGPYLSKSEVSTCHSQSSSWPPPILSKMHRLPCTRTHSLLSVPSLHKAFSSPCSPLFQRQEISHRYHGREICHLQGAVSIWRVKLSQLC